jgi:single-stranded-DNA-specific exonuclease
VGTNHLKFNAIPIAERSAPYPAIAFQMGECINRMRNERFDLCYQLEENYWRGRTEIQLNVKDIKFNY